MELASYGHIVVLTGAGISRSAGLPTYRGPGGLWTDPEVAAFSDARVLTTRRAEACGRFWSFQRATARSEPTPAHRALAAFEARLPATTQFLLVTQNVDGLHQRAGSARVCEYHGSLARWRCDECGTELAAPDHDALPMHCNAIMRPAVVLFGEQIPVDAERRVKHALRDCDLFVAIGTSGNVTPASSFVRWAELNGARRILLNLEVAPDAREAFGECHTGVADDLVPHWFG